MYIYIYTNFYTSIYLSIHPSIYLSISIDIFAEKAIYRICDLAQLAGYGAHVARDPLVYIHMCIYTYIYGYRYRAYTIYLSIYIYR